MVLSSHTSPTMIKVISKKKGTYHILAPVQASGVRQWRERAPHSGLWVEKLSFSKSPSAELALISLRVRYNICEILSKQY